MEVPQLTMVLTVLPGPDRKRRPAYYQYRMKFHSEHPETPGCVALWEVAGGREAYQISVEREESGRCKWHCTCADAVYRGELDERHRCKHVQALQVVSVA